MSVFWYILRVIYCTFTGFFLLFLCCCFIARKFAGKVFVDPHPFDLIFPAVAEDLSGKLRRIIQRRDIKGDTVTDLSEILFIRLFELGNNGFRLDTVFVCGLPVSYYGILKQCNILRRIFFND